MNTGTIACLTVWAVAWGASAADLSQLTHRERSFTIRLNGSVAQVTPLFGPVREREWSPEWLPQFVHPKSGEQIEGAVFTTETHGQHRIWVLTHFDVEGGRVEYVVVAPGLTANQIKIQVVADGVDRSEATITYRHTALATEGNRQVERLDEKWAEEQRSHWETAINRVLAGSRQK